jgi:hypothetical protein
MRKSQKYDYLLVDSSEKSLSDTKQYIDNSG